MEIGHHWMLYGSLRELESQIGNIKLSEEGLYLTKTDTGILQKNGETCFTFYCWNTTIDKTAIDERKFKIISDER